MVKAGAAVFSEQPDGSILEHLAHAQGKVEDVPSSSEEEDEPHFSTADEPLLREAFGLPPVGPLPQPSFFRSDTGTGRNVPTAFDCDGGDPDAVSEMEDLAKQTNRLFGSGSTPWNSGAIHDGEGWEAKAMTAEELEAFNALPEEQRGGRQAKPLAKWVEEQEMKHQCVLCANPFQPGRGNSSAPIVRYDEVGHETGEGEGTWAEYACCDDCNTSVVMDWRTRDVPQAEQATFYHSKWVNAQRSWVVTHEVLKHTISKKDDVIKMLKKKVKEADDFSRKTLACQEKVLEFSKKENDSNILKMAAVRADVAKRDTNTLIAQAKKIEVLKKEIANRDAKIEKTKWATALVKSKPKLVWKYHMESVCRDINNDFLTGKSWSYHRCAVMDKYYRLPQVAKDEFLAAKPPVRKPRAQKTKKKVEEFPCLICSKSFPKSRLVEQNGDLLCKRCK